MEYVDWLSLVSSFLLVIILLGGTLWGLKRFGRIQLQGKSGQTAISLIDSLSVGARQRIILVEADGQRMLIGVTPQSITGLGQWPSSQAPDFTKALKDAGVQSEKTGD